MSSAISTILANLRHTVNVLRSAVYAIDVRDDIADAIDDSADAIEQIYGDVNSASLREDAFAAALQEAIDDNLLPIPATVIDDNSLPGSKIQNASIPLSKLAEPVQITVDSALSATSTNPVQNKVIKGAIDELNGSLENLDLRLSDDSISLLEYVLEHVAYTTDDMQSHVDDLIITLKGDAILKSGAYIPKKVIRGAYINEYGEIVEASTGSGYFEEFIKIPDSISGELCGCYSDSNRNYRISEYDEDKNFIKQTTGNNYNFAITLDTDTVYVRFGFYTQNATTPVFSVGVPDLQDAVDLDVEIGDISNTTGEEITEPKRARSGEIEVDSNVVSVYGCFWAPTYPKWHRSALYAIRCYDASDTYLGASDTFDADVTNLTLPEGTKSIRFIFQKSGSNIVITPAYYPMWVNGIKYKMQEVS